MNTVFAVALAGFAAMATVWVLAPKDVPPRTTSLVNGSAFLEGWSLQLAADGSCETRSDVGEPLMSGNSVEVESTAEADPIMTSAEGGSPEQPVMEVARNVPIAGTCGQHLAGEGDVGDVATDVGIQDEAPTEQMPAEPTDVAMPKPETQAAPAPAPAPAPMHKSKPRRVQAPTEPLTAWWPTPKADSLNVLFVGEAAFGSAISVLTDGRFETADSANANIQVRSEDGSVVSRRWQLATNRQMLLLLVEPGLYTISIRPQLTDAQGRRTGSASSGPVFVR